MRVTDDDVGLYVLGPISVAFFLLLPDLGHKNISVSKKGKKEFKNKMFPSPLLKKRQRKKKKIETNNTVLRAPVKNKAMHLRSSHYQNNVSAVVFVLFLL